MIRRTYIISLLLFIGAGNASAQTLTIEQCRDMALQHNKDLESANMNVTKAEYTRKSTHSLFLPDFSLNGFASYSTGGGTLSYDLSPALSLGGSMLTDILGEQMAAQLMQKYGSSIPKSLDLDYKLGFIWGGNVMLKQPLFMGGRITAGYKMSKLAVQLYKQNRRKSEAEVIEKADEAYAMLVKANELKTVAEKYQTLLQELDRNVESAVRNGMRLENDRMKVQVKLNEVQLQLRKAENGIRLAKMNLCHVIGQPLTTDILVSIDYPRVSDANALAQADITQRPEYQMLDLSSQISAQKVKTARADILPQLALLASYGYLNGVKVMQSKLMNSGSFTGGVTLKIPLDVFGKQTNKMRAAKIEAQQAQLDRDNKAEMMQLEAAQSANNLDEANLECELAEKTLSQAETSMNLSKRYYDAGTETLSNYLESQATWQKAYETRVNAYFQRYLSSVSYLKACGQLVSQ